MDLIKVEYEVLPAVLSLDEALAPGAPLVHDDAAGNVAHHFSFERGDVDAGFKASDVIVEGTWQSARQWHTALETIGCVAQWARRPRHDVVQYADAVSRARPLRDRARRCRKARCASSRPRSAAASAASRATTTRR